jgi:hypothetical protein
MTEYVWVSLSVALQMAWARRETGHAIGGAWSPTAPTGVAPKEVELSELPKLQAIDVARKLGLQLFTFARRVLEDGVNTFRQ